MSVASGQGPREKSRQPKAKANPDATSAQLSTAQTSTATPVARDAASGPTVDDSSKGLSDAKTASMYDNVSSLPLVPKPYCVFCL